MNIADGSRFTEEEIDDLVTLCENCHMQWHRSNPKEDVVIEKINTNWNKTLTEMADMLVA